MTDWKRLSRLPESPEYWDRLGARVQQSAHPAIAALPRQDAWTRLAWRLSALAAAAAIFTLVLPRASDPVPPLSIGLAPADPVAFQFVARDRPPAVSELFSVWQAARR